MVPLFKALLDYDSSPEVYERYDRMTARELFREYGVSQRRAPATLPADPPSVVRLPTCLLIMLLC